MAATPTITVECAFVNSPTSSSRTWTDISSYCRGFTTNRGRQTELDRIEAGTATILLSNLDQRFDPNNTSGPYYGNLVPMRPIRITVTWNGTSYPVFSGLVKSWPQEYPGQVDAVVNVQCVDLFRSLNLTDITASYSSEASGTRVANVLTSCSWPTGATFRDLDTGNSTLQASTLAADGALSHLQDVAVSEQGPFFMSRDGKATFIDRHTLLLTTLDTSLTWGDGSGEKPYLDIGLLDGEQLLWNSVTVTAPGQTDVTETDSTSQSAYFTRSLTVSTLLTSTNDMTDLANYLLTRYKQPHTRVSRLVVTGMVATSTWPDILGREIGDKIRVRRNPPGTGSTIQQDSVIEGIAFAATPGDVKVTWSLSPMVSTAFAWILDDSVQSILDSTTYATF